MSYGRNRYGLVNPAYANPPLLTYGANGPPMKRPRSVLTEPKPSEMKYLNKSMKFISQDSMVDSPQWSDANYQGGHLVYTEEHLSPTAIFGPNAFGGQFLVAQNSIIANRGTGDNQVDGSYYNPVYVQWKGSVSGTVWTPGVNSVLVRQVLVYDKMSGTQRVGASDVFNEGTTEDSPMSNDSSHFPIVTLNESSNKSRFKILLDETKTYPIQPLLPGSPDTAGAQFMFPVEGYKSLNKLNFTAQIKTSERDSSDDPPVKIPTVTSEGPAILYCICVSTGGGFTGTFADPVWPTENGAAVKWFTDGTFRTAYRDP